MYFKICDTKGLFTRRQGTPGKWGNPLRWSNPPVHITSHVNKIKLKWDSMDRQVTPHKRVTSPTRVPPTSCVQALSQATELKYPTSIPKFLFFSSPGPSCSRGQEGEEVTGRRPFSQKKISRYLFYCTSRSVTIDADQGAPLFQVWMKFLQKNTQHQYFE